MLAAGDFYPYSCNPDDVWLALNKNRDSYFFIDVQSRGYYPSYAPKIFKDKNVVLNIEEGDADILKKNTVDFIALSYKYN